MDSINNIKNSFSRSVKRCGVNIQILDNINKSISNTYKILIKETKDKTYKDTKQLFASVDIPLQQGDTIIFNKFKYLVVQADENTNNVYNSYNIRRISNQLNFKFADDIYSIDTIIDDSIAKIGNDIPTVEGRIEIITQANKITKYLQEDTRFLLWGRAYIIEAYTQTNKNIIKFYCKKTQIKTDLDNIKNNVGYNEDLIKIYINDKYEIATSCDSIELKEDTSKKLNIVFKKNGEVVNNPSVTYTYNKDIIDFNKDTAILKSKRIGLTKLQIKYNNTVKTIHITVQESIYTLEIEKSYIELNVEDTYNINIIAKKDNIIVDNPVLEYIYNKDFVTIEDNKIKGVAKTDTPTKITIKYKNVEKVINVIVKEVAKDTLKILGGDTARIGKYEIFELDNPSKKDVIWSLEDLNRLDVKIKGQSNTELKILTKRVTSYIGETFKIKVCFKDNKSVFDEKEIKIKSMF